MIDAIDTDGGEPADLKKGRRRKFSTADPLKVDRLPPHSIEAEQGVLGCALWRLAPRLIALKLIQYVLIMSMRWFCPKVL